MAVLEFVDYEEVRKAAEPKKAETRKTKEKKEEPKGNE
jgi:hypothetical protein